MKDAFKRIVPAEAFVKTEEKIDHSFACGYGTVLFFEDQKVVKGLQEAFPSYQENFPGWSLQTSAMHQLAIWVMLEDVGFGASLQHYNPLIDEEVRRAWDLPEHWHLIAEMPFGLPVGKPGEKEFQPLEERVRIFKYLTSSCPFTRMTLIFLPRMILRISSVASIFLSNTRLIRSSSNSVSSSSVCLPFHNPALLYCFCFLLL